MFCGDVANFTARLQAHCGEKLSGNGCECFQFLKILTVLKGRTTNMMVKLRMMNRGTDTTCEFVNFCSLRFIVVVPSSSVKVA